MNSYKPFAKVQRVIRHIERYRQILGVLISYGFYNIVELFDQRAGVLKKIIPKHKREKHIERLSQGERICQAVEELGPTFIKLAQIISTRPDLIPPNIANELTRLQDNAQTIPYSEIKNIIEFELEAPLSKYFISVDPKPLAAASIAQVHTATLLTGEKVVLKVQRPNIAEKISVDLEILSDIAKIIDSRNGFETFNIVEIVEHFSRTITKELDFLIEESNIAQFKNNMKSEKGVFAPIVYSEITTSRLLCMELIVGNKPDATIIDKITTDTCKLAAKNGVNSVMKQVFIDGFFHADPHPGNLIIGDDGTVYFIDFGMVGRVSQKERNEFTSLLKNLAIRNNRKVTAQLINFTTYTVKPNMEQLEHEITELIDIYIARPMEKIDYSILLSHVLEILTRYKLTIQPHIFLMLKAVISVEGVGRALDPSFQLSDNLMGFAKKLWLHHYRPDRFSKNIANNLVDILIFAKDIPEDIRDFISLAKDGHIGIDLKHSGLDKMLETLDKISNRITFAITQASLIIGSSLILHANVPPYWHGIPIIGLLGFVIAGFFGIVIILQILRK